MGNASGSRTGPWVFTKRLAADQRTHATTLGLSIYEVELFTTERLPYTWPKQVGTALFTSVRAVEALGDTTLQQTGTPIFCVGTKAAEALKAKGLTVTASGFASASELAAFLGQFPLQTPVVHFCGQSRRPELREGLDAQGVQLVEVPVYARSPAAFPALPDPHAGAVFFSPRGVARFFEAGPSAAAYGKPVFALGPSTAAALGQLGLRPSATPPLQPDVFALLDALAAYNPTPSA